MKGGVWRFETNFMRKSRICEYIFFLISFLLYSTEEEDSWSSGSTVGSEDDSDETIEFGRYSGVTS